MGGPGMAAGYALGILFVAVPVFHFFVTWGVTELRLYAYKNRAKLKACCLCKRSSDYDVSNRVVEHRASNGISFEHNVSEDVSSATRENVICNDSNERDVEEATRL